MVDYQTISIILTGIGIIAAITYYTLTLRNANKTRQAQLLMQVYNRLDSPGKIRSFNYVFNMEFKDYDDFLVKYSIENNPEAWDHINSLITTSEGVGTLVKTGNLPVGDVYNLMGGTTIVLWEKLDPIKEQIREHSYFPQWASETEYLYNELMKYLEEHPELKT